MLDARYSLLDTGQIMDDLISASGRNRQPA